MRQTIRKRNIAAHLIFVLVFSFYLALILKSYPFQPLSPENPLVRVIRIFNDKAIFLRGRFRMGYLLVSAACYCSLLFAFIEVKRFHMKCFWAIALAFIFSEFTDIFRFTAGTLVKYIAYMESYMLRISGFIAHCYHFTGTDPIVGTNLTKVTVAYGCSGLNGIALFCLTFTLMLIFDWYKINKVRAIAVMVSGVIFMLLMNLARIYIIIVVGHITGSQKFMSLFHEYGGIALYFFSIFLVQRVCYRWLLKS